MATIRATRENMLRIQVKYALWERFKDDKEKQNELFALLDPVLVEWVRATDGYTVRATGLEGE